MKFKPKFKKFGKLPGQPSKLIRIALADLEKVEKSPAYVIDMSRWHEPRGERCYVCLAGAVISRTLSATPGLFKHPCHYGKEYYALLALNCFRMGKISNAFFYLDLHEDYEVQDIDVPNNLSIYWAPNAFKKYLNTLADSLESQGF